MTVFVGQLKGFKSIKSVSSAYVRLTLYDNEKKLRRRKTTSTSITLLSSSLPPIVNCVWNESLQFDLSKDKLHSGMLTFELTVVGTEHSLLGTDSVIGSISLGPKTPLNSNFVKQNQTSKFDGTIAQDLPRGFQSGWCRTREDDDEDKDDDDDDDEDSLGGRNEPWWEVILSDRHQSSVEFYPLR